MKAEQAGEVPDRQGPATIPGRRRTSVDVGNSGALVECGWVEGRIADGGIVVLDASFKLPGSGSTARQEFEQCHIPTAQFFDIEEIADRSNPLPHMLPRPEEFVSHAERLGISDTTMVVVYDTSGLMSAARAWWMFRFFGHENVAILNGGMPVWLKEQRLVTDAVVEPQRGSFSIRPRGAQVRSKADILANLENKRAQMIDARSTARFKGDEPEIRPGLRSGHIPGSLNFPFALLTDPETGRVRSPAELRMIFEKGGLAFSTPTIATCGSGVTACVLAFGLHLLGRDDVAVYDGSWAEWGAGNGTPVAIG